MKNFKLSYLYVVALVVIASACKKEEEVPRGEYAVGVVVVNEGNFFDADGTFGFLTHQPKKSLKTFIKTLIMKQFPVLFNPYLPLTENLI